LCAAAVLIFCDNADMQVVRQKRGDCKLKDRDRPLLCAIAHKADDDSPIQISNSQDAEHTPLTAVIPRHRVSPSASPMTGSSGVSSTPRLLGSITTASGILDHPLSRVMTRRGHLADTPSHSRRMIRASFVKKTSRPHVKRAQGMPGGRCARSLACKIK
jgi:hypothetical protein